MKLRMLIVCGFLASRTVYGSPFTLAVQDSLAPSSLALPCLVERELFDVSKQFIGGQLFGMVGGLAGIIISLPFKSDELYGEFKVGLPCMFAGYVIGNAFGVYAVGNARNHRGPFGPALIGSIAGAGIGLALYHQDAGSHLGALGIWLGAPIGSIIGFNLFRENKTGIRVELFPRNPRRVAASTGWFGRTVSHPSSLVVPICLINIPIEFR
jgi:hypothetical protein